TEGTIPAEVLAVKKIGGQVRFIGSVQYSSTKLLNQYFDHLSEPVKAFCETLASKYTRKQFFVAVQSFASLKALVIGDTIFHRSVPHRARGGFHHGHQATLRRAARRRRGDEQTFFRQLPRCWRAAGERFAEAGEKTSRRNPEGRRGGAGGLRPWPDAAALARI